MQLIRFGPVNLRKIFMLLNTKKFLVSVRRLFRWVQIDRPGLLFGLRAAITALAAFAIASLLHVQNAYWAAMAAWIIMQPTRGILLERGFYRVIGTVIGAAAGFAILHWISNLYLAIFVLSVWMAVFSGLTHLFRRVSSYGVMLCGITPVVVVMPTLLASDQTFDVALARVICTLIGVVVATVSGLLFVPRSPLPAFIARMRRVAGDSLEFAALELGRSDSVDARRLARELIVEMAALEQAMLVNTAGSSQGQRRTHHFTAFIGASLEVMAAAQAAGSRHGVAPQALLDALLALAETLQQPHDGKSCGKIVDQARQFAHAFDSRLAKSLDELLAAEADVVSGQSELTNQRFRTAPVPRDKDWQTAGWSALATWLAVWFSGSLAILIDWKFAPLAALGIGNFVMLLSSMERPQIMGPKIFQGACAGVLAAILFRTAILPHAQTTLDVVLMVMPFLLLGGLLRASKLTTLASVDYVMCFMLAGQPFVQTAHPSLGLIVQEGFALVLGTALVSFGYLLLPRDPGQRVRNIAGLIVRDLERMADLATTPGERWHALTANRLLRLTVHLGRIENLNSHEPEDVLAALNLAHAIVGLRDTLARPDISEVQKLAVASVIAALRKLSSEPQALMTMLKMARNGLVEAQSTASAETQATFAAAQDALAQAQAALKQGAPLLIPVEAAA